MIHYATSRNTSISRSLMAGLATGILAAVLIAAYMYFFRKSTDYAGSVYFEPLLVFIAMPLIFLIAGLIYYGIADAVKRGGLIFTLIFLALMIIGVVVNLNGGNQQSFLLGIILISGLLLSFLLPYLATHAKIFMDEEEMKESGE